MPTRCWCSIRAASSSAVRIRSCLRAAGCTRTCIACSSARPNEKGRVVGDGLDEAGLDEGGTVSKGPVNPPAYWYGDLPVPFGSRLLSGVYGAISGLRRNAYRKGWLKRGHPGVPVLVVGNLTA